MKIRLIVHLVAFLILVAAGAWIAYRGVVAPTHVGQLDINVEFAAMYWFALLIYGFVCIVLYYPLRRRSWPLLLIGHASAATIALVSTYIVITLGALNSPTSNDVPSESTQAPDAISPQPDAAPGALPLPLPPREN